MGRGSRLERNECGQLNDWEKRVAGFLQARSTSEQHSTQKIIIWKEWWCTQAEQKRKKGWHDDCLSRSEEYLAELSFAWRFSSTRQIHIGVVMERTLLLANVLHSHNKRGFRSSIAYPGRAENRGPSLLSMWLLQACNKTGAIQFPLSDVIFHVSTSSAVTRCL
jgi:hypothetical protein